MGSLGWIEIVFTAPEDVAGAIASHHEYVTAETLALALAPEANGALTGDAITETDLGSGAVRIAVRRATL